MPTVDRFRPVLGLVSTVQAFSAVLIARVELKLILLMATDPLFPGWSSSLFFVIFLTLLALILQPILSNNLKSFHWFYSFFWFISSSFFACVCVWHAFFGFVRLLNIFWSFMPFLPRNLQAAFKRSFVTTFQSPFCNRPTYSYFLISLATQFRTRGLGSPEVVF